METDSKLDKIRDDVNEIKVTLAKIEGTLERNTDSLIEHVKRTDLLETKVELLKTEVLPLLPELKRVLKYWPILSAIVIAVVAGKPEIMKLVMQYLTPGAAP
jgi:predicted nuclease with TOPRIM domain